MNRMSDALDDAISLICDEFDADPDEIAELLGLCYLTTTEGCFLCAAANLRRVAVDYNMSINSHTRGGIILVTVPGSKNNEPN